MEEERREDGFPYNSSKRGFDLTGGSGEGNGVILVAGGTGRIGQWLVYHLLRTQSRKLRLIVRTSHANPPIQMSFLDPPTTST